MFAHLKTVPPEPYGEAFATPGVFTLFLSGGGKVLVVCDGVEPLNYPSTGIYAYRDWSSSDPQSGDLVVFDQYADVTDYSTMKSDQFTKFDDFTGFAENNSSVPTDCSYCRGP
jgi:hypothetical protein